MERKDLRKLADRPRENRRSVEYVLSLKLDIDNSEGDASEQLKLFKKWVVETFTQWDRSILEHFLYNYNLLQDYDSTKYHLEFKVEGLTQDDSESQLRPQILDTIIQNKENEEESEDKDNKNDKKEEDFGEHNDEGPVALSDDVKDYEKTPEIEMKPDTQRIDFRK